MKFLFVDRFRWNFQFKVLIKCTKHWNIILACKWNQFYNIFNHCLSQTYPKHRDLYSILNYWNLRRYLTCLKWSCSTPGAPLDCDDKMFKPVFFRFFFQKYDFLTTSLGIPKNHLWSTHDQVSIEHFSLENVFWLMGESSSFLKK